MVRHRRRGVASFNIGVAMPRHKDNDEDEDLDDGGRGSNAVASGNAMRR